MENAGGHEKKGRIKLLFKADDKRVPKNYRPICVNSILSKLMTQIITVRLTDTVERNSTTVLPVRIYKERIKPRCCGCVKHSFNECQVGSQDQEEGWRIV